MIKKGNSLTGLPPGLLVNPATGVISGRPERGETYSVTMMASNVAGNDTQSYLMTITDDRIPRILTPRLLPDGEWQEPYETVLEATGAEPITWSETSGSFPRGLTLTSEGVLQGTPEMTGTFSADVTARNAYGNARGTFSLTIVDTKSPHITTTSLPAGEVGQSYSATVEWTGELPIEVTTPLPLPQGLTATPHDLYLAISGTPGMLSAGIKPYDVQTSNAYGTDSQRYNLIIAQGLIIAGTLPTGTLGEPYDYTFTVTGGTALYTWTFTPLALVRRTA